jgi:hypothetical protein
MCSEEDFVFPSAWGGPRDADKLREKVLQPAADRAKTKRPTPLAMVVLFQAHLRILTDANVKAATHLAP